MKDVNDNQTADLLPINRPRGRPRTGKAATNAERQAKHRAKQALLLENSVTVTVNKADLSVLKLALRYLDFDVNLTGDQRDALARIEAALYPSVPDDTGA